MNTTRLLAVFLMVLSVTLTGCPSDASADNGGAASSSGASSSSSGGGY